MLAFWNSLDMVSAASTTVEITTAVLGIMLFIVERRETSLESHANQPRKLSETQKSTLLKVLQKASKGPIKVNFLGGDSEAADYAAQFKDVFETAGFNVVENSGFLSFSRAIEFSLEIACIESPPQYAIEIEKAFIEAGFNLKRHDSIQKNCQWVSLNIGAKPSNHCNE